MLTKALLPCNLLLVNTGLLLAAEPSGGLALTHRVFEHGLCRSLGLEVVAKDFLLDIQLSITKAQRWFMELRLASSSSISRPPPQELGAWGI